MNCGEISAVVLAAGMSVRMGQNKLLMEYRGEPMLIAALRLVVSCGFRESVLVISSETLQGIDVPPEFMVVVNPRPEAGQGGSVALGAAAASMETRGLMFFQADMPSLDHQTVLEIASAFDGEHIAVPFAGEKPRSPVIFPVALKGELAALAGEKGGRALFEKHRGLIAPIPIKNSAVFRDIDAASDYKALNHM